MCTNLETAKAELESAMRDVDPAVKATHRKRKRAQKLFVQQCKKVKRQLKQYPTGPQALATLEQQGAFEEPTVATAVVLAQLTDKELGTRQAVTLLCAELETARADLITATSATIDPNIFVRQKVEERRKRAATRFTETCSRVARRLKRTDAGRKALQALKDRATFEAPWSKTALANRTRTPALLSAEGASLRLPPGVPPKTAPNAVSKSELAAATAITTMCTNLETAKAQLESAMRDVDPAVKKTQQAFQEPTVPLSGARADRTKSWEAVKAQMMEKLIYLQRQLTDSELAAINVRSRLSRDTLTGNVTH
jgi:hypothetical protein